MTTIFCLGIISKWYNQGKNQVLKTHVLSATTAHIKSNLISRGASTGGWLSEWRASLANPVWIRSPSPYKLSSANRSIMPTCPYQEMGNRQEKLDVLHWLGWLAYAARGQETRLKQGERYGLPHFGVVNRWFAGELKRMQSPSQGIDFPEETMLIIKDKAVCPPTQG